MFYLIQSNRMESLSEKLASLLSQPLNGRSILQPEQVLVQSPGMSTWLRLEIAKHNGIAAAIDFPLPSSFTWQLCHDLLPQVPKENAFTKAMMTWKLMSLLPTVIDKDEFLPLKQYLKSQDDSVSINYQKNQQQINDQKHYQLCNRIADIFDQYLVFRPDWIESWENNESLIELEPDQQWQPILWRCLIDFNNNVLEQSQYHRANLHHHLINKLIDESSNYDSLPKRLFVFGISSMPPQFIEILHGLAQRIDVFMFNLSPCQHYWGDIVDPKLRAKMAVQFADKHQLPELWEDKLEVGNPLLANNGKMGRELLDLILELPELNSDLSIEYYQSPLNQNSPTILHGIQHDILEMETLGQPLGPDADVYRKSDQRRIVSESDDSILFVSCHSPLREIETLHDHLLTKLEQDPKLKPKDIVIMLPDVASYAPYIDAVFSSKQGQHYLPYAIADRGVAQESPLVNSFLSLLKISISRYAVTDIISILEVPAVLQKFNIDDDELQLIKRWLNQAGVRWGRDQDNRAELGIPSFEQNSWAFGLKRLILGYAFSDDSPLYHDSLKVEGVEGMSAQSLGKLLNFIEAIDEYHQLFNQPINATERLEQLNTLVDAFYVADDYERPQLQEIRDAITKLKTELTDAGFYDDLNVSILNNWFTASLTESRVGQRYLAGSINFCTLMPMRSIPFKLVCLLGMNDGVYPRTQHPVGFDLVSKYAPRKGDRSRRLDDRYLFLEALLSARQQLYISYIGNSERDNSERIPSMLVSELQEYCQLCYQLPKTSPNYEKGLINKLIKSQPLQPFDTSLYESENAEISKKIASYDAQWCPPNKLIEPEAFINSDIKINTTQDAIEELDLSALIRFYRNPAQYFFNRTLNLDLGINIDQDENDEPFTLNALERYKLQDSLLTQSISQGVEDVDDGFYSKIKATGELPVSPFDDILLSQYKQDLAPLIGRCLFLRGEEKSSNIDINLSFDEVAQSLTLVGRIDDVCAKGLINVRPGKAHGRDLIRLYIRHLALNAMGHKHHSFLLDISHYHALLPLKADSAKEKLAGLLSHYFNGLTFPLPFLPKTSLAYANEEGEHAKKLATCQKQWLDEQSQLGESNDPHYRRLYQFPDDFSEQTFGAISHDVLLPMISIYSSDTLAKLSNYVDAELLNKNKEAVK
ncbi:exodeoxyribonuclease V subunit gamma [Parashewanella spongiae]|uniref:RecBCD enzyme subunit RecC n=1 Tax=Parashewanella spongiae TaxID=342950 RepID=A0A3A6UC52_9GAMM|nr:exodeoxyribonuclease V subunit gamma [Parashewanella spongiae]MCL1078231.1 exodeoxyribonuclease V subunit gamma [Parashewanella spongiae]RJY16299.1 exodeoxyribonuclease V subunit gamma [Parashewanella spongiae]